MNKQEILDSTGYTDAVPLNDYLDGIGDAGREWFDDFKPDPYFSYDRNEYDGIEEIIREEFERETEHLSDMLNERFELLAGIDENGKAELFPCVYDNEKNSYMTIYEMAELVENELPQELEISVPTNRSFSWESGWDYNEKELTVSISDADVSEILLNIYNDVRKETEPILDKQSGDKEIKVKSSKNKQEAER